MVISKGPPAPSVVDGCGKCPFWYGTQEGHLEDSVILQKADGTDRWKNHLTFFPAGQDSTNTPNKRRPALVIAWVLQ